MSKLILIRKPQTTITSILISLLIFALIPQAGAGDSTQWKIHDVDRPNPIVVTPGTSSAPEQPGRPPSDAIVLFDGADLSAWRAMDGQPAKWVVKDGYMESVAGSGYIRTLRNFGDCQLHVEWASPERVTGSGQGRGNSGVFLMGKYEIQVLDSHENRTYADGQASAVYGQYPPQVNASRGPGQWQTYDIIFRAPRFDENANLVSPAFVTVLHNGVLTQNHVAIKGPTTWCQNPPYEYHPTKLPLSLQDHGNPVRYRNIWIRELPAPVPAGAAKSPRPEITLAGEILDRYVGDYRDSGGFNVKISKRGNGQLRVQIGDPSRVYPIVASSETEFFVKPVDIDLAFSGVRQGKAQTLSLRIADGTREAERTE